MQTAMTDEQLFDALAAKAAQLREEAEQIESFALHSLSMSPRKVTVRAQKATAPNGPPKPSNGPKNPKLVDTITNVILGAGGTLSRKDIIQEVRRLSRGHVKHIAVVAALRAADRFRDIGNGVFTLAPKAV